MSERYTKVFSLPPDLYAQGSPLVISAGNLLKDNLTGKVLVQLKIRNISPKTVKTGKVLVHAMDTLGKPLDGDTTHEYLDLSADQGDEFGQKTAIPLPNPSTRGFTVEVRQVGFADNSVWEGTNSLWEPLPAPESLNDALHGDPELVKQFRLCFGDPCEAMPRRYKDVWRCACSAWNTADVCYYCGKGKDDLLALDLEKLIAEKDARLAREKAEREAKATAEKAAAEANARKTKKILTILIPFVVVCVAAVLAITKIIIPNSHYKKAMALFDAGQYEEAITAFEALDGYKDSVAQAHAARGVKTEQERLAREAQIEAENAAAYQQAETMLKRGNYDGAIDAFKKLGKYRNSEERLKEAKYAKAELLLKSREYESAANVFVDLNGYKDSKVKTTEAKFLWADSLLSFGQEANYENNALAWELFKQLGGYKDAKDRLQRFRRVLVKEIYEYEKNKRATRFVYDESGRDITHGEVYNEANQVIEDGTYTYSYDKNGRLSKKVKKSDNRDKETYTYTVRNELVTEERHNWEYYATYSKKTYYHKYIYTYKYDEEGRMIWKETTSDGKKQSYSTFTYDKEGKLTREDITEFNPYKNKYYTNASYSYRYSYDGDDLITKSYYEGNKKRNNYTYEYGYIYAPKVSVGAE